MSDLTGPDNAQQRLDAVLSATRAPRDQEVLGLVLVKVVEPDEFG